MKHFPCIFAALLMLPVALWAQAPVTAPVPDSSAASGDSNTNDAAATVPLPGQPAGPALEKPVPLMPENVPSNPKPRGHSGSHRDTGGNADASADQPALSSTQKAEENLRVLIRLRQLQTRAANDPVVQEDWRAAHQTRNDPERRRLLAIYYNDLYGRMRKMDKSLAVRIDARKESALARLRSTRLREDDTVGLQNNANPIASQANVDQ